MKNRSPSSPTSRGHAFQNQCTNISILIKTYSNIFPKILHRLRYSEYKFDLHILNSAGEINAFLQLTNHFEDCMTWKVAVRWVIPRKTMHQTQGNFLTEHVSMSSRDNEAENRESPFRLLSDRDRHRRDRDRDRHHYQYHHHHHGSPFRKSLHAKLKCLWEAKFFGNRFYDAFVHISCIAKEITLEH